MQYMLNMLDHIGETVIKKVMGLMTLPSVIKNSFLGMFQIKAHEKGEFSKSLYESIFGSIIYILIVFIFLALILISQLALHTDKMVMDVSPLGPLMIKVGIIFIIPFIAAFVLTLKKGIEFSTNIENKNILKQDQKGNQVYIKRYVSPRILSFFISTPLMGLWGGVVFVFTMGWFSHLLFDTNYRVFFNLSLITPSIIVLSLLKLSFFGMFIPILAAWNGLLVKDNYKHSSKLISSTVFSTLFTFIIIELIFIPINSVI